MPHKHATEKVVGFAEQIRQIDAEERREKIVMRVLMVLGPILLAATIWAALKFGA